MKISIAIILTVLLGTLILAGCTAKEQPAAPQEVPVPSSPVSEQPTSEQPLEEEMVVEEVPDAITIEITSSGFKPETVTVQAGGLVTWLNRDSADHWPASAVHPYHTIYPGSSINKCNGPEETEIFDACTRLQTGQTYSFTFEERGTWKYHDHLNPKSTGTVIVE